MKLKPKMTKIVSIKDPEKNVLQQSELEVTNGVPYLLRADAKW
jgi:hypothetical protein